MQCSISLGLIISCGALAQSQSTADLPLLDAPPAVETAPVVEVTGAMHVPPISPGRPVDLAICLDTSGSMSGLIEAAKQKLWAIVNDLALAEPTPDLRVALLTYGSPSYGAETGWVRMQTPFTGDLDLVSERLFALGTAGGAEYVGRVLQSSLAELGWTASESALKLIIVAGNESADQDRECPFREMCGNAIARGIMVNSIYCGSVADSVAPEWREVATLADGHFASIDHNGGTVIVSTPFDDRLAELGTSLNTTYIAFGAFGAQGQARQQAEDANAQSLNSAAQAARTAAKAGKMYRNSGWDLVDASREADFDLEAVAEEDLPENIRSMTAQERRQYIDEMFARRQAVQAEIAEINRQRQAFIEDEMTKQGLDESKSFDAAVRNAIRAQAESKGFLFPTDEPAEGADPEESSDAAPAEGAASDASS